MPQNNAKILIQILIFSLILAACGTTNLEQDPSTAVIPQTGTDGEVIIIEPGSLFDYGGVWNDFLLKMNIRKIGNGNGALALSFRANGTEGTYILLMDMGGFFLQSESGGELQELAVSEIGLKPGESHQLELEMIGGEIRVFYLGDMVIEYIDPNPLPAGGISFEALDDITVELQNLEVETLGEPVAQAEEQPEVQPEDEEESETSPAPADEGVAEVPQLGSSKWQWVRLGGPSGGTGYDIRYNFDDPNIWYVTDAQSGVHMSTDNGLTWFASNEGLPGLSGPTSDAIGVFCLTVDPHDPQIIWIGTIGHGHIYRSTDGGYTWETRENGIEIEYDQLTFRGFTVDPKSSDIVYAMAETVDESLGGPSPWMGGVGGVVYKTTDAGENWSKIWDGGMRSSLARYMWIDPDNPDVLYVSTGIFDRSAVGEGESEEYPFGGLGVLKSTDGGETWEIQGRENGLGHLYIGSLYMHPEDADILLAAAGHGGGPESQSYMNEILESGQPSPIGIYRTTDGGETWVQTLAANEVEIMSAVELCPSDPNIGYAATRFSMYRTQDAGITWELTAFPWSPPGISAGFPIDMQCDPRNVDRVFVNNYGGGNYLSEDGGKTWISASTGYTGAEIYSLDFDPEQPEKLYAISFGGIWRSDDAGTTWTGILNGPDGYQGYRVIAVDPDDNTHIFAGQYTFIESNDSGSSWKVNMYENDVGKVIGNGGIPAIKYAPSDSERMYAGFSRELCAQAHEVNCMENEFDSPVFIVSRDGGASWQIAVDEVLGDRDIRYIAVDPKDEDIVYVASDQGIYKTENAGVSWTELPTPAQNPSTYSVAVDPEDSSHLLVGVDRDGIYQSTDGGQTWLNSSAGMELNGSVATIVFDPTDSNIIYAADYFSGVYRSEDSGTTWTKINNGLHSRAIADIIISADGNHIYAASNEDGVYRMDLNGQAPDF